MHFSPLWFDESLGIVHRHINSIASFSSGLFRLLDYHYTLFLSASTFRYCVFFCTAFLPPIFHTHPLMRSFNCILVPLWVALEVEKRLFPKVFVARLVRNTSSPEIFEAYATAFSSKLQVASKRVDKNHTVAEFLCDSDYLLLSSFSFPRL